MKGISENELCNSSQDWLAVNWYRWQYNKCNFTLLLLVVYRYSYTATNPAGTQHCSTVASMLIFVNPFTNKLETPCTVWLSVNAFYRPILFLLNVTSISGCLADHLAHGQSMNMLTTFRYYFTIETCFLYFILQQKHIFMNYFTIKNIVSCILIISLSNRTESKWNECMPTELL